MDNAREVLAAYLTENGMISEKFSLYEAQNILDTLEEHGIVCVYSPKKDLTNGR